jgi:hypothetical protein
MQQKHAAFLERNRVAAVKCRQRKRSVENQLEEKAEFGREKNELLRLELDQLMIEVIELRRMAVLCKKHEEDQDCLGEKEDVQELDAQTSVSQA